MNIFGHSLALKMAIATLLGLFCGIFFGELCSVLEPWAAAYIMILKITAVPYLIVAVMHGVGQMSPVEGKEILKKGMFFASLTWIINIAVIYLMAFLFPHAEGIPKGEHVVTHTAHLDFATLLIPENIFYALANNIIPAAVIFSLIIGLSLIHIAEKKPFMSQLETAIDALTRITRWISTITPLGTFLIIANQMGTIEFVTLKQLGTYVILYILGAIFVVFWIFPRLVAMLTPIRASQWIKDSGPILILAYTTNTVLVCLPYIIQLIQKETKHILPRDKLATQPTQGVVSVIFNLPLASLFITLFVLFLSAFYQVPLSMISHFKLFATAFLTGLGAIGIGSWINSLTFILEALGLPLEGVKLYLSTIPFTGGFQSMISTMEITSLSLLIILAYRDAIQLNWKKLIRKSFIIFLPIVLLIMTFSTWNFFPVIQHETKELQDLSIACSQKITVHSQPESAFPHSDTLARILARKTLRVGYYPHISPYCFFNKKGELAGYDIAFACKLASDLEVDLEFIPLHYAFLKEELEAGLYDIGMSAISLTEQRLKNLCFSTPYSQGKYVLITPQTHRKLFAKLPLKTDLKIAVLKNSALELMAHSFFPDNAIILLNNYEELTDYQEEAVALLWEEKKAIAWVQEHPPYTMIFPNPSLGIDTFAFPLQACDIRFLNYINQWLILKKNEGFTEEQHKIWILKQPPTESPPPRWSVWHNVLVDLLRN